jgi:plastocyanin
VIKGGSPLFARHWFRGRSRLRVGRALVLAAAVGLFAAATPAQANVHIAGNGEPYVTKGSSNTWWWSYDKSAANPSSSYYICYTLSTNGGPQSSQGCYYPTSNPQPKAVSGLSSGNGYVMCATEYYDTGIGIVSGHAFDCKGTTIDNTKPSVTTSVDGTATFTNNPQLSIHIAYSDAISPSWYYFDPFHYSTSTVTYDCLGVGAQCTPQLTDQYYDAGCSVKDGPSYSATTNSNDCTVNWTGSDGKIYYCARQPDSAFPDNASNSDQLSGVAPTQFNVSDVTANTCGYVTLDRHPPTVTVTPATANVTTGTLVNFSTSATDDASGTSGSYDWDFGDNTAHGSGTNPSHTYTQPGTFQVKSTTSDGAGNHGQGTATITVTAPASGGNTGGSTGGNTGGNTGGSTGGNTGGSTGGNTGGNTGGSTGGSTGGNPVTTRCVVPKLKGTTIATAKRRLAKAHCALGKVTKRKGPKSKKGKVVAQAPKPGTNRPARSRVALVIGK